MASTLHVGPGAIGATLATWLAQDERHESVSRQTARPGARRFRLGFEGKRHNGAPFPLARAAPTPCYQNRPRRPTMIVRPESNSVNVALVNCEYDTRVSPVRLMASIVNCGTNSFQPNISPKSKLDEKSTCL